VVVVVVAVVVVVVVVVVVAVVVVVVVTVVVTVVGIVGKTSSSTVMSAVIKWIWIRRDWAGLWGRVWVWIGIDGSGGRLFWVMFTMPMVAERRRKTRLATLSRMAIWKMSYWMMRKNLRTTMSTRMMVGRWRKRIRRRRRRRRRWWRTIRWWMTTR
jgi:hypothetical protein